MPCTNGIMWDLDLLWFMLEMLLKAMQELVDGLQRRKILLGRYEKLVGTFPESENEKMHMLYIFLVRATLFSEDGISTAELQEAIQDLNRREDIHGIIVQLPLPSSRFGRIVL